MARRRGLPADLPRWTAERDRTYRRIKDDCWGDEHACFSQRAGAFVPDAAVLLMPMVKLCSSSDPRSLSTFDELECSHVVDSLVFRYRALPG
ncbi:hypothetical protein [Saccharopolyspora gregorii]|uniref:Uncharacterized protein n=1 Tax=Saccharopolyspora gregorii TaxID=33914 RepID=A0ABP6RMU7_9PSEU